MKKVILIVVLFILLTSSAFAQVIEGPYSIPKTDLTYFVICIKGYSFLVTYNNIGYRNPNTTQIFKEGFNNQGPTSIPMKCTDK